MNEYENIETVETVENDDQGTSLDVPGADDPVLSDSTGIDSGKRNLYCGTKCQYIRQTKSYGSRACHDRFK